MFEKITRRRCDEAMRRSKENGIRLSGEKWRCPGDCPGCICCIEQDQDGNERHIAHGRRHEE